MDVALANLPNKYRRAARNLVTHQTHFNHFCCRSRQEISQPWNCTRRRTRSSSSRRKFHHHALLLFAVSQQKKFPAHLPHGKISVCRNQMRQGGGIFKNHLNHGGHLQSMFAQWSRFMFEAADNDLLAGNIMQNNSTGKVRILLAVPRLL